MIDAGHWCQRRRRSDPSTTLPIRLVNSRQVGPQRLLPHAALTISPSTATAGCQHRVWLATSRRPHPHLLEIGLAPRSPCLTHNPLCQRQGRIASVDSGLGLIRKSVGANVPELTQLFP